MLRNLDSVRNCKILPKKYFDTNIWYPLTEPHTPLRGADGLPDAGVVAAGGHHRELVPVHDRDELRDGSRVGRKPAKRNVRMQCMVPNRDDAYLFVRHLQPTTKKGAESLNDKKSRHNTARRI